jgi:hypothetical protein
VLGASGEGANRNAEGTGSAAAPLTSSTTFESLGEGVFE